MSPEPDHAEILRSGPRAWNAWREKNPSTIPGLSGIALQLSERQMGPINGGPINLKSARLQDAFLRFATLSAADLEAADMSGADLVHARFDQANLSAANLRNALLDYADFTGANLTKVNLCGARLRFATLSAADLEAADMCGADLMHARFDQANLSTANLSNALLDHADFSGANLKKVKLCGASLHHAKNLTHAQIEDSVGRDSAILPPYLQESMSGSVVRSQTETTASKRRDLRPRTRHTADVDLPRISSSIWPAWIGVLLIGGALVSTGFVWQHMNEAVPPMSGTHQGLQPSAPEALMKEKAAAERRPSADVVPSAASAVDRTEAIPLDTSGVHRGLQPSAPEALMEEKAGAEHRPSADPEIPPIPSASNTAERIESAPEQRPALEKGTVPQDTSGHAELQASDGARPSTGAFEPYEHAPGSPEEGQSNEASEAPPLVSAASPVVAASRHGTVPVPESPAEASAATALISAESPVSTSQHGTVPDLPTEASMTTPEHSSALSLGERLRPPVVTIPLPSSVIQTDVQTVLPETPPTPVRNPARPHGAKGQNSVNKKTEAYAVIDKDAQTVSPSSVQTPPRPVRNPAR